MLGTSKYLVFLRIQHLEPWGYKCHVSLMKQVTSPPGNTVLPCICRSQGEKNGRQQNERNVWVSEMSAVYGQNKISLLHFLLH